MMWTRCWIWGRLLMLRRRESGCSILAKYENINDGCKQMNTIGYIQGYSLRNSETNFSEIHSLINAEPPRCTQDMTRSLQRNRANRSLYPILLLCMRHASGIVVLVRALPHMLLSLLICMYLLVHMQTYHVCFLHHCTETTISALLCVKDSDLKQNKHL